MARVKDRWRAEKVEVERSVAAFRLLLVSSEMAAAPLTLSQSDHFHYSVYEVEAWPVPCKSRLDLKMIPPVI